MKHHLLTTIAAVLVVGCVIASSTGDTELIKKMLASTEGRWILNATGKEQGQAFNDTGIVINKWNESKSELRMESTINRGDKIIELLDIIKIDNEKILMDRGDHKLIGTWNSKEKLSFGIINPETLFLQAHQITLRNRKLRKPFLFIKMKL